jgi:mRNA-degrading endonuclease RelE of RelBE toxin-antitoxin system
MRLWIEPEAFKEIQQLPGALRARIRRVVNSLEKDPRPPGSKPLNVPEDLALHDVEARRLRVENWRVIYVIDEPWATISILAVRKRPPYDYEDLADILSQL